MFMTRIREVVHLDIVLYAFAHKAQTVFPYDYRVNRALAYEQLALEVLRLVEQAGLCIAFRIGVRMIHVAFSVHYLIPFPVYDRASCHSHLEYVWPVGNKRYCHEASVAPSVHSDSSAVHIRQFHKHLYAFHLVCHLRLPTLSMYGFLEISSTVGRSPVVLYIYNVSALCHVHFPSAQFRHECVADHL